MSEPKGWSPRVAVREGADGFVYLYLARQDTMEGAEEICRFRKEYDDGELSRRVMEACADWMMRSIARFMDKPLAEVGGYFTTEPPEKRA